MGDFDVSIPRNLPKGTLVDNLGHCALLVSAVVYFVLFFGAVTAGVMGPSIFSVASNPAARLSQSCSNNDLGACGVTWYGTLTDMSPQHQFMWLNMNMDRPSLNGAPALTALPVSWGLMYQVDITAIAGDGTRIIMAQNQTHVQTVSFASNSVTSGDVLLFYTQEVRYPTYQLTVRFVNAMGPFGYQSVAPTVSMGFTMTFVNKAYTQFELGWKMFFVTTSALLFMFYTGLLFCGPGVRDEETDEKLPSTVEQIYVWWLGLFLIWFNDPLFQVELDNPSIVTAGLLAFATVTFLAALLMFWLVSFDLARLQGEGGFTWQLSSTSANELGVCFWLPKVVLMTVFWTLSLAGYMYLCYTQLSDPSFNIWGDVNAWPIARWFYVFGACLVGAYMVYLFALVVLSMRNFMTLRPGARLSTTLTLCTIVVLMTGLYMNVFTPLRSSAAAYVSIYAAANLYVWWLMLAYVPGPRLPEWFVDMVSDDGMKAAAARRAMATGHVNTRLGGSGKRDEEEDDEEEDEGEEEGDGEGLWAANRGRNQRHARNRRSGGSKPSDFTFDVEDEDEEEGGGRGGRGGGEGSGGGGRDSATANAIAHAAASAAVAAMRAYTGSLSQVPRARRPSSGTASRASAPPSRLSAPPKPPPRSSRSQQQQPQQQQQRQQKPQQQEEQLADNIVSFLGPDGKEALRAAAYLTEAGETFYVGEDGHAFILSPEGTQVFLDEMAAEDQQMGQVEGGVNVSTSSSTVKPVEEKPPTASASTKVRFAESVLDEEKGEGGGGGGGEGAQ